MSLRLSPASLDALPRGVRRPRYDRAELRPGVVHIGIGAFHRAHQAPVFEALAEGGDLRWGVVGASLRSPAVRDSLQPQDWLYSLLIEERDERQVSVIGALRDVIVAPEDPTRLVEALASPDTQMVTVTVTEKGYKLDRASDALDEEDPDVRADLASMAAPRTMAGFLAAGLRLRKERELPPFTAISCDNLPGNGRNLGSAVLGIAAAHDPALADWISAKGAFPETMIDRIVPATTEADVQRFAALTGVVDRAMVRTEPFTQWVIEDRFAGERPEFERAGVQVTADVAPWETAKLRLLNGAHSAMAYLGGLAGHETVDRFFAEPVGRQFVELLWDELQSTLSPPPGLDLHEYRRMLARRFANSALAHRLRQIAMDGSQKIPQRLLAPMAVRLGRGEAAPATALAIAAWIQWQRGRTDSGESFEVDDPLASTTARLLAGAREPEEQVRAILTLRAVFPERIAEDERFRMQLIRSLGRLQRLGARAAVEQLVEARASG